MITLTNPDTGTRHAINAEAAQELADALHRSSGGQEIVFRAMRLDRDVAKTIVETCGFVTTTPGEAPTLGEMLTEDDKVREHEAKKETAALLKKSEENK